MTSATLAADGKVDHLVARTCFEDAEHLLLGSPFDYPNSALVCLPFDVPEPSSDVKKTGPLGYLTATPVIGPIFVGWPTSSKRSTVSPVMRSRTKSEFDNASDVPTKTRSFPSPVAP